MTRFAALAACAFALAFAGAAGAFADGSKDRFQATVASILAQPYQPDYVPAGLDSAFSPDVVPNTEPAEDFTSGSIPGSPDHPGWPAAFSVKLLHSGDGAPFFARAALHPGRHPGIVVVHGFNTNGLESVIRWAAMLYANGYDVVAADQRDFKAENDAGLGQPAWRQTFGWKESQDVLAAGRWLAAQKGVVSVGVVGFSEGAQNTVLALAADSGHVFKAGLTFSGPADQDTQIYSTAVPAGCQSPNCSYPATNALVTLVVPPYSYTDPCPVLADAAALYKTTPFGILAQETSFHAQTHVQVPLLNVYANDDPLVAPFQATMMAGYEGGNPLQRTVLIQKGAHAYFYDRWWQQEAMLLYFKSELPGAAGDPTVTETPTVNRSPAGAPLSTQLVDLGSPTRAQADSYLAPFICDTSQGEPGRG
jgi:dienelactone hydrolase